MKCLATALQDGAAVGWELPRQVGLGKSGELGMLRAGPGEVGMELQGRRGGCSGGKPGVGKAAGQRSEELC